MIGGKKYRSRSRSKSMSRVKRSKGSKRRRHSKRAGKKSRKSKRANSPWIVFVKKVKREGNHKLSDAMKIAAKDPRWLNRK